MRRAQGPNLGGLFGRVSGSVPGFAYSKANKEAAVTWNEESLFEYLLNPKKYMLIPVIIMLRLAGLLVILGGTKAAPFIYTLF